MKAEGARACAERTWNMLLMVVTLDVSKLSGWLNFDAFCRVERRAYDAGRDPGQEAGGAVGLLRGTRRAHLKHIVHGCDLGRVEVQRLVERLRALSCRDEGIRCLSKREGLRSGARCWPGAGGGRGRGWAAAAQAA